jgi:hypothetical protein
MALLHLAVLVLHSDGQQRNAKEDGCRKICRKKKDRKALVVWTLVTSRDRTVSIVLISLDV